MNVQTDYTESNKTLAALEDFPVPLLCPRCAAQVTPGGICRETGKPCVGEHAGMPRFLFGQKYWGETGSVKMRELLAKTREGYWKTVLESLRGEPVADHLLSPIRADFLHAMPWTQIRNVLDIGSGMGFMSCDMAPYAKAVVALEAVPERAEFIKLRAQQDHLPVFPVIASAMDMPFPAESFDLVTLNGVFEYIGLWGGGNPKQLQQRFLELAIRLLRPGGYLYVGIETRYSMSAWLGARDHSGLAFTSVMPRWMADLYCRLRAHPGYGAEHVDHGYRTYTHTPMQYARMFRKAGYDRVVVYGAYDGYNRQRVLYRMDDHRGRKAVLARIDPPASFAGKVRRHVEHNRALYRTLEQEVVVFGRKASPGESSTNLRPPMPWSEVEGPGRSVVQINLPYKTLGVICSEGVPIEILDSAKWEREDTVSRMDKSAETVCTLEREVGKRGPPPIRWPKPLGSVEVAGRRCHRYEYVCGSTLANLLLPTGYEASRVQPLIRRASGAYIDLCNWMTSCFPGVATGETLSNFERQIESAEVSSDIRGKVLAALATAKSKQWKLLAVHGDFTASNLIVDLSGALVLVDWEHFTPRFPIGAELIRFHQDILMDAARLSRRKYLDLCRYLDEVTTEALSSCGYGREDYDDLRALYIGHQILALGGEQRTYEPLLKAYRDRKLPPGQLS